MRHKILFLIFFSYIFTQADPLLVAVLMVKDEAPVMCTTLQPLVDAGIDAYFIYDTGSTDDTIQVTKNFFAKNNITNFGIAQEPWIDFGASRTRALRLTEQYFPDAIFMLMLDAEWQLQNGESLLKFCQQERNNSTPIYLTRIIENIEIHNDFVYGSLIRCNTNIYYIGKVYETPNMTSQVRVPDPIYIKKTRTNYGKEKSEKRWKSDCEILLKEIAKNSNDFRSLFFLAQTYFCLQDWQNAAKWYKQCIPVAIANEDKFTCMYALGKVYDYLGNEEKMNSYYFKAFNLRPHRAEPLIRLAIHFFNAGAYALSYLLIKHTIIMPYPNNEISAVERELYDFVRYDVLSRVAWIYNEYELGKWAAEQALQTHPHEPYLHEILNYYQTRLDEKRVKDAKTNNPK